ncbi:tripartite tricarboxylate transporter TctB family protein [Ostreibacterium oceani]|uniref:Tripartite tricarboxylate transporter TctB family protein n=1 Tax=Ostreibacterium oceani TaxID=2654998 RepID=A0A6N7F120_9GAMM|nr:tripartite tricarboxylate transporter TctB family protein [Ostreibacterium oceani]MPV86488.1 tripartite tricarboxylate transporter TctB family protein [Ostreibacterium oceani]
MTNDRIGALLLLVFCITYGILATQIPLLPIQAKAAFTAKTMPMALTGLGIVLSLILLIKPGSNARPAIKGFDWQSAILICALMVAYGFLVKPLGFILATILFLASMMLVLGERRWWLIATVAITFSVSFWLLMNKGLDVYIEALPAFLT